MRTSNAPVAAEGYPFIAIAAFITLIFALLSWKIAALFFLALTLFIIFFFRNPERRVPEGEETVVAPADGRIIYLGDAREPHTNQEMIKISIFMSVFNVHINRAPLTGAVVDTFYIPGRFLDVRDDRATSENERSGLVMESAKGLRLVVVQVAGLIARRIICYAGTGDKLIRGERYGLIRFGSRLDVYLPKGSDIRVVMGDTTRCGETILGYLP
ncbi:MAG TPA: phosphatidylserine decarboxylase family protein [Geobacterales bacterium]|nr:phosphatidylserine decarboxylase family protein [Geobacterales bacterium]